MGTKHRISAEQRSLTVDTMITAAYRVFKNEVNKGQSVDVCSLEIAVVTAFEAAENERKRFLSRFSRKGIDCRELESATAPVATALLMAAENRTATLLLMLGFARGFTLTQGAAKAPGSTVGQSF
jgi:hypothetical protein